MYEWSMLLWLNFWADQALDSENISQIKKEKFEMEGLSRNTLNRHAIIPRFESEVDIAYLRESILLLLFLTQEG